MTAMPALTRREQEVVAMVIAGKSSRAIADELFVSCKTVEAHRQSIYAKLGIRTVQGLIAYAIATDNVPPDCLIGTALAVRYGVTSA